MPWQRECLAPLENAVKVPMASGRFRLAAEGTLEVPLLA